MKNIIIVSTFIMCLLSAKDNTALIKVDGMKCSYSCAGKVSDVVQNMKGVKECSVDFDKGVAKVVYDDKKVAEKDIVAGLSKDTSYKVSVLEQSNKEISKDNKI